MPGGSLPAGTWIKAVYGWGYFSVEYGLEASVPCDWNCYVGVSPFPISSGTAYPGHVNPITHSVIVYGDIWLRGHSIGAYALVPIGPGQAETTPVRRGVSARATELAAMLPWAQRTRPPGDDHAR